VQTTMMSEIPMTVTGNFRSSYF